MENKVTLYIATHNTTGLKYFGKTTKYFTQELLQEKYHGSGKYWKNHLKKHSNDVTMEVYGIYNIDEVKEIAINFSSENKIVESKDWANLKEENGKDGGWCENIEHRKFLQQETIKRNKNKETRKKFSLAKKGSKSPTALKIEIYNKDSVLQYICSGNFTKVCSENSLPFSALRTSYKKDGLRIFNTNKSEKEAITRGQICYKNWYAIKV